MTTDLILGTAGHIDHGKTSLIRALTGVDTDRLPEEKKRGITIELGFAELSLGDFRLGIVDVPGHERFVRNMLAGATGMDLALLVVAADDSIKPQTREHLEILRLLDLEAGVIALTKCDLADPEWMELVEEEIRELVTHSFLADAPIVRTSTATGEGLDVLRQRLAEAAQIAAAGSHTSRLNAPFRMAIDRTFTIAGHGTVVTGSVSSGRATIGDELLVEPGDLKVRVRGIQNHDRSVESVQRGQRAAINLAGIRHDETSRGQELCSPGHLTPSRLVTAGITLLPSAPRPLKDRTRVRIHVGTAELLASVRVLGAAQIDPGSTGSAQLFLSAAAATVWGQPFVVRSESPVQTIGGGRVLDPDAERIRHADDEVMQMVSELSSKDIIERGSAALYFAGFRDWQPDSLSRTAGIDAFEDVRRTLADRGDLLEVSVSPKRVIRLHRLVLRQLCRRIESTLEKLHMRYPLRSVLDRGLVANQFRYLDDENILTTALKQMASDGIIKFGPNGISLVGHGPKLSQNEQKLLSQLIETLRQAGIQAPSVKECQQQAARNQESVPQLLALGAASGELVEVNPEYYLHTEVDQAAKQKLSVHFHSGDGLTMSQIREILETSRKYAVPYCEYLDRTGFTLRHGDLRVLASI
ncbi:MAG: selenocysteine-specific translation elongation factor [Planctomycetaceae bacterium]|nr:selenocysteine-specific translation elongation factor [Planctomycetales bacterium]MCB9924840.1 selenocysteine-specific translation elongation factor [Planctomycetaceae bacterium]